jgi:DNA-binding transcriptional LysR family regulator
MDLNRIAVFARVAETGSFTAAAAGLGVQKSSVSRSVAALEADLGVRLLQRTTRRIGLTDAGRAYYQRARDALGSLEEARQAVASLGAEPSGSVRITAPVDVAGDLAAVTDAFLRQHPRVRIEVVLTARVVDLVKEGFDLAIRGGVLTDSSLMARRLGDTDFGLFAAPAYLARAGRPRRVAELARHECILYRSEGGTTTWRLAGPRGEERVAVRGRVEGDEFAFVRSMALAGFGIALGPLPMFTALAREGALERVLPQHAVRGSPVHVVWPSRRFEPAAVTRLRDAIATAMTRSLAGRGGP